MDAAKAGGLNPSGYRPPAGTFIASIAFRERPRHSRDHPAISVITLAISAINPPHSSLGPVNLCTDMYQMWLPNE
jgi:hypothetical protein